MNTKQIIDEMEKELNKFFDQKYPRVERWQYDGYIDTAVPFIHSYTRKLIESVVEELLSSDVVHAEFCAKKGEQYKKCCACLLEDKRLKVKEIITNLK